MFGIVLMGVLSGMAGCLSGLCGGIFGCISSCIDLVYVPLQMSLELCGICVSDLSEYITVCLRALCCGYCF